FEQVVEQEEVFIPRGDCVMIRRSALLAQVSLAFFMILVSMGSAIPVMAQEAATPIAEATSTGVPIPDGVPVEGNDNLGSNADEDAVQDVAPGVLMSFQVCQNDDLSGQFEFIVGGSGLLGQSTGSYCRPVDGVWTGESSTVTLENAAYGPLDFVFGAN